MTRWTAADIPPQRDRLAVVTGSGGLGLESALALGRAGARVVIAGRDPAKGSAALDRVRTAAPAADVRFEELDLASLSSVRAFAGRLAGQADRLDLLVNNAGVMRPPRRLETEDGFELQFGVNYLGHVALTGALLPLLRTSDRPRVVTLSSVAALQGAIRFDDLQSKQEYQPMHAYAQSKLACLLFALELQRRSEANAWGLTSLGAHPGLSRTALLENAPGGGGRVALHFRLLRALMMQSAAQGALPTLYAATAPEAEGGGYYGPDGPGEIRGSPAAARLPPAATDLVTAKRLWDVSENLIGASIG